ncbi:MAG: adenylate/guanylate cyclase domain-containing protein [Solirubrobacterales bacterium]
MRRLAAIARVIVFDKRGSGLSDPVGAAATIEERIDDIRAVMDAAGSERADVFGWSEGATMAAVFGAGSPDRVSALVLYGSYARGRQAEGYPWGSTPEAVELLLQEDEEEWWGQGFSLMPTAPSRSDDEALMRWWARFERQSMSPTMARAALRMAVAFDIRDVLPSIHIPTLVIHRTGERQEREPDRVLATVLFTDIVGSTERATALGDRRWRDLLDQHDRLIRRELDRYRGREVKTTGDGVLATFDGPARGINCARAICEQARPLGIDVRAGLHTGECELRNGDVGGVAVHIGARVASMAGPGEVVVSGTVKDLVVGSGLEFTERGSHSLKGVPGEWRLYAVGE